MRGSMTNNNKFYTLNFRYIDIDLDPKNVCQFFTYLE